MLAGHLVYPQLRTSLFHPNRALPVAYAGPALTVLEKQGEMGGFGLFN